MVRSPIPIPNSNFFEELRIDWGSDSTFGEGFLAEFAKITVSGYILGSNSEISNV